MSAGVEAGIGAGAGRRCGFVAIVGAPNAGKSTLMNRLLGAKVAIVPPKVQTTRARIIGVLCEGEAQFVFVDTPGIFNPRRRMERAMVAAAWHGAGDADLVLVLVDAERGVSDDVKRIKDGLKKAGRNAFLVVNKIDLVRRETGGRVLSAKPVNKQGRRGYNVRVLLDGKRVKQYYVDAQGRMSAH